MSGPDAGCPDPTSANSWFASRTRPIPGDTGWHIDSSFPPDDGPTQDYFQWRVNVASRERALLMLFLYSEVGPEDAPTRIRVGSHLDVTAGLAPAGPEGMPGLEASVLAAEATASRPVALATGDPGDVYLCLRLPRNCGHGFKQLVACGPTLTRSGWG